MNKKRGFTLIELLVVIAIVGLLSSIVLSSLSSARSKARDSRAISEVNQIRNALESYYTDNGSYPHHGSPSGMYYFSFSSKDYPCGHSGAANAWCNLETALSPYISSLPRGSRTSSPYEYLYKSQNGNEYALSTVLENSSSTLASNDGGVYSSWYEVGEKRSCPNWAAWNITVCVD